MPGEPVEGTEQQKQRLLNAGQAYEDASISMDNTKDEIIEYLEDQEIEYSASDTKAELLDLL